MTAAELKQFRLARGWSQAQMGQLISDSLNKQWKDVARNYGTYERGRRPVPGDIEVFLANLELEGEQFTVLDGDREIPHEPIGDTPPPQPPGAEQVAQGIAAIAGGGSYSRVCEELWELVATGVGMVGAVTGSEALRRDGEIIAHDKQALGKAYGKLAEQNATFRNMLAGMTGGGAWLEVALVSGITAGKLMRNHQAAKPLPAQEQPHQANEEPEDTNGRRMYGDGAVIDLPV